ncbi:MAG: hypothetical protein NW208_11685 [Bryobacter sp.]|nr:hypothetical protein [Bryobacter sp.]
MQPRNTLFLLLPALLLGQQDVTFRSETRVFNLDVLVEDTKTRKPVETLRAENFRVKLDGRSRTPQYFSQGSSERRPLALLIYFNLAPDGALRQLANETAQASFAAAMAQLRPMDEAAVYASRDWFVGKPEAVTPLTQDREALSRALATALQYAADTTEAERRADRASRTPSMENVVREATDIARQKPQFHTAVVYISDGMNTLDTIEGRSRREIEDRLLAEGISFSALNVDMLGSYAAAAAVLNPIGLAFGMKVTGATKSFAAATGGLSRQVESPALLGAALAEIVSAYASRYSLGFTLSEAEFTDGKQHKLEIKLEGGEAKTLRLVAPKRFRAPAR